MRRMELLVIVIGLVLTVVKTSRRAVPLVVSG